MAHSNYSSSEVMLNDTTSISSVVNSKLTLLSSRWELKALTTVLSIASFIGLIGNVLVCFVVSKFRFLGRQKAELFITSLAVADLLICVCAQPLYIAFLHDVLPDRLNIIRKAITWISTLVSVNHLFAISIERFFSLYFLHRYTLFIPDHVIWSAILVTWLVSIAFGAPSATFRIARISSQYFLVAILVVIPILYTGTFYLVRLQRKRISKQVPTKQFSSSQQSFRRQRNILYMIVVVVGVFYLCFIPLVIVPFFFSIRVSTAVRLKALRAFPWINTLALCNSSLNPYLYYWRSYRFRLAMEFILRRLFEKK